MHIFMDAFYVVFVSYFKGIGQLLVEAYFYRYLIKRVRPKRKMTERAQFNFRYSLPPGKFKENKNSVQSNKRPK